MTLVLGVDAGGTKTRLVAVRQDATVVRDELHGPLDPTAGPNGRDDLDQFLVHCGPHTRVTIGLPYYGEISEVTQWQNAIVMQKLGLSAHVTNDVDVAHMGAFAKSDGLLVLAGTGSMAWAVGPAGTARAGGFGDIFGDEGSAFWIGQQALATASCQIDGRIDDTRFATSLCAEMTILPDDLIDWTYRQTSPRIAVAGLAIVVAGLADQGDLVARDILTRAAAELAMIGKAAAKRAGLNAPFVWSTAGGVFANAFIYKTLTEFMGTQSVPAKLPPVGGAVLDAALRADWPVDESWITKLGAQLRGDRAALGAPLLRKVNR